MCDVAAVERSITGSLGDARDALVNAVVDMLGAYGTTLTSSQRMGQLPCPYNLRFMPAYALALLKFVSHAFALSILGSLSCTYR